MYSVFDRSVLHSKNLLKIALSVITMFHAGILKVERVAERCSILWPILMSKLLLWFSTKDDRQWWWQFSTLILLFGPYTASAFSALLLFFISSITQALHLPWVESRQISKGAIQLTKALPLINEDTESSRSDPLSMWKVRVSHFVLTLLFLQIVKINNFQQLCFECEICTAKTSQSPSTTSSMFKFQPIHWNILMHAMGAIPATKTTSQNH